MSERQALVIHLVNIGHTISLAIEAALMLTILHGECVVVGILKARRQRCSDSKDGHGEGHDGISDS